MEWVMVIVAVAIVGCVVFYNSKKKKALIENGAIIDRDNVFFKQEHIFQTKTSDFSLITETIKKSDIFQEKVSFEQHTAKKQAIFRNKVNFGTFVARLIATDQHEEDGRYCYKFQVEAWREGKYGITRQDLLGANELLTVIEKAFLSLDPNTSVQSVMAQYKTKTTFL